MFYLLDANDKALWSRSIWSKPVRIAVCPNPTCGLTHFKQRANTLWCTKKCGSAVRMRKTRERRRDVGVESIMGSVEPVIFGQGLKGSGDKKRRS